MPTPPTDCAYDSNGNRLTRTVGPDLDETYTVTRRAPTVPNREYHYNQAGRPFKVIENGLLKARYTYNAQGQPARCSIAEGPSHQHDPLPL